MSNNAVFDFYLGHDILKAIEDIHTGTDKLTKRCDNNLHTSFMYIAGVQ